MAACALGKLAMNFQAFADGGLFDAWHLGCDLAHVGNREPGSVPSRFLRIQVPRLTGEVRVPFDVSERIDTWVGMPPR